MDPEIRARLDAVRSADKDAQDAAFTYLMDATDGLVDWAYQARKGTSAMAGA